jgi:streptogramin lyase
MILRVLTVLFLAATIAAAANDVLSQGGMASLGEVWFTVHSGSLNLSQAVIQRYLSPEIWDPYAIWVLGQSATVFFGLLALVFFTVDWISARRR